VPHQSNPHPPQHHGRQRFVEAFVERVRLRGGWSSTGSRLLGAGLVVALVVAGAVVVGVFSSHNSAGAAHATAAGVPVSTLPTPTPAATRGTALGRSGSTSGLPHPRPRSATVPGPGPDQGRPAGGDPAPQTGGGGWPAGGTSRPAASTAPATRSTTTTTRPQTRASTAPTAPRPTFHAVAGYHCTNTAAANYHEVGRYTDGRAGWISVSSGGYKGSGCTGAFDAMPMSGSATKDDPSAYAVWKFSTGPVISGHCSVSVFDPSDTNIQHNGGRPAVYFVYNSFTDPSAHRIASFSIDQTAHRGHWVGAGTFPVTRGQLIVKLVNRGLDWVGDTKTYAHLAAAQVSVTCTG